MFSLRATRRASSTASSEQHLFCTTRSSPSSSMTPGSDHRRSIMPITSCPCSFSSAAATELSTPPLIATTILAIFLLFLLQPGGDISVFVLTEKRTSPQASLWITSRLNTYEILLYSYEYIRREGQKARESPP